MNNMRILIAYDGSSGADAALFDLQRAGLPQEAEALVISDVTAEASTPDNFWSSSQAKRSLWRLLNRLPSE